MICTHLHQDPQLGKDVFVAPGVDLMGDVTLGPQSSVWYQSVLRADIERIEIGEGSNIQDGTVIHLASDIGTQVGDFVTVGHKALLHACSIGDESLIGMGSIIMDEAVIGAQCIIGAGSLVTKGTTVPDGSMVLGSPAGVVRQLDRSERLKIRQWAEKYIEVAKEHRDWLEQKQNTER